VSIKGFARFVFAGQEVCACPCGGRVNSPNHPIRLVASVNFRQVDVLLARAGHIVLCQAA